jgi:hypothetical protein
MWKFVCEHDGDKKRPIEVRSLLPGSSEVGRICPPPQGVRPPLPPDRTGDVAVLGIGRMGAGITRDFANHNDLARDLLLGAARQNIKVVQQDFGFTFGAPEPQYPESSMERIADFLLRDQGEVFVVLSNYRARSKSGAHYSNRLYIEQTAQKFREVVKRRTRKPDAEVNELLCRRLHVAPFRFGADNVWPGNIAIGNHAKFWMIDDRAFYIGSDNIYPVDLQEFGYIVDSKAAAADIHREYWDPLWRWSAPHAISGAGAPRCLFTEQPGPKR